ncbi:MAG: DNA-processing protein DprA [Balneolaceae bacterium]|nr:DNA-processing protein DprA [Balneolaceae bacterium]
MKSRKKTENRHHRELLALSLVHKLGNQRIKRLLNTVSEPREIFRMSTKRLTSVYGIGSGIAREITGFNSWQEVDAIIETTEKAGARLVTLLDPSYPTLLKEIYDPPVLLWIKGNEQILSMDSIAIVGTRSATRYGKKMATRFSGELVREGYLVISGLAYGIDGAAHRAALDSGGYTVAVLGSGIDRIYPAGHRSLAREIIENDGAVITEYPPGTAPDAGNFPMRNRVVSGMSLGTLVVESGLEGGSMITAGLALDQNREVFVVPHNLDNRHGAGCNDLIKKGAGKLVQETEDILVEMPAYRKTDQQTGPESKEPEWKRQDLDELSESICRMLEDSPLHIDRLVEQLQIPAHRLLARLLELEMKGCIKQHSGKIFEAI